MNKNKPLETSSQFYSPRFISLSMMLLMVINVLTLFAIPRAYAAFSFDPALNWYSLQSEHFDIHFHDGEEKVAQRAAAICEQQYLESGKMFDWYPQQRVEVVLVNTLDISNAAATPLPVNTMLLFLPASEDPGEDYDDWLRHLITHEYTHIVHLDKASGLYNNLRGVFGREVLFFPNMYQPAWVLEGLATYRETRPELNIGRGQSSIYRNLMRIEWEQGLKPLRQVNLPIVSWPGGTTRYLYGVYFFNFIRDRYGANAIPQWVAAYSSNLLPWSINRTAERQFKTDMSELWDEFKLYLDGQFLPLEKAVKAETLSQGSAISHSGYVTGNIKVAANGDIYYVRNDLLAPPHLIRIDASSAKPQPVMEIYGQSYDVSKNGIVFNQYELQHNTNRYNEIYRADLDGGRIRQLTDGGRYTFVLWSGDNIIALQQNGISERLQLLDINGKPIKTLWQGSPGVMVSKPELSGDGKFLVAAVWRPQSRWEIERFNIDSGHWERLSHNPGNEASPIFSKDGKHIYFVADYAYGIYNIFRMNLDGGDVQRLSNDLHSIIEVAEINPDEFVYTGLHASGSDVYRLSSKLRFPLDPQVQRSEPVTGKTENSSDQQPEYPVRPYSALSKITPAAWYPFIQFDVDSTLWGFQTDMYDPLQRHNYSLFATYDSDNQWFAGQFGYLYDRFNPALNLYFNRYVTSELDDNDNPLNWISTEQSALELMYPIFKRDIKFRFDAGIASEKSRLIKSSIADPRRDSRATIGMLALNLSSAKAFARSINPAQGYKIRLARENYIDEPGVEKPAYLLDWRHYFTLHANHTLAAHFFRAKSDDKDPFQLGGVYAGYYQSPIALPALNESYASIHGRDYALRGYKSGLPQLRGSDVALTELEYRFPIASIERGFMAPPLGINRIHGGLFYSAANPVSGFHGGAVYRSAGIETKFELIFGYLFPLQVDLGYAKGLDEGGDEIIYGKIGGSF